DRDGLGRADVVDLTGRRRLVGQGDERADRVRYVAEAARLPPVTVDLQRRTGKRRLDEARDHVPVLTALPGPDGVEEARDDAPKPVLFVPREGKELVHSLGVGVGPALRRRRPVDSASVFAERQVFGLVVAVHL